MLHARGWKFASGGRDTHEIPIRKATPKSVSLQNNVLVLAIILNNSMQNKNWIFLNNEHNLSPFFFCFVFLFKSDLCILWCLVNQKASGSWTCSHYHWRKYWMIPKTLLLFLFNFPVVIFLKPHYQSVITSYICNNTQRIKSIFREKRWFKKLFLFFKS